MDALNEASPPVAVTRSSTADSPSKTALWAGRILSGIGVLFLAMDATMKVLRLGPAIEGTIKLGYPESTVQPIGIIQVLCLVLYLVPRTSVLGAVLWTGFLGGAMATHVRIGDPPFTLVFPVIVGALLWGGLWLRDTRLRAIVPVRAPE